jgi:hypothetical protein
MIRNAPKEAAVFGVDLGKNLFHVVGLDARGGVVQRAKFRRDTVLAFSNAPRQPWWGWRPALDRSGSRASCRRSDTRCGSCRRSS